MNWGIKYFDPGGPNPQKLKILDFTQNVITLYALLRGPNITQSQHILTTGDHGLPGQHALVINIRTYYEILIMNYLH